MSCRVLQIVLGLCLVEESCILIEEVKEAVGVDGGVDLLYDHPLSEITSAKDFYFLLSMEVMGFSDLRDC